ncbi:MAG: radical SAM family heme chaperone HemW [Actinomycetaceae bacterium]|nr:radical SAM family heme chaperone HemW [Actinomycetaceae bacterium]
MRPFSLYVHVPFCRVRCGYCDFNTYVADFGEGAGSGTYFSSVLAEADRAVAAVGRKRVETVFFGGGTPTMLSAAELASILRGLRQRFDIASGAEITTEANPDSVDQQYLEQLVEAGFTRISFGMQSAVPHVLARLDRTHTPARLPLVTQWAKQLGLEVSVDLIYGTPGETIADWKKSVEAAVALEVGHISAYALVIEPGTKMGRQLRAGQISPVDSDDEAEKYALADSLFAQAGYRWYEISNWAKSVGQRCRHNMIYWEDGEWWGLGPGAHSHIGDERFWNVKHPAAYAQALRSGHSVIAGSEHIDAQADRLERLMLGIRMSAGVAAAGLDQRGLAHCIEAGWVDVDQVRGGRVILTLRGRLMADAATLKLLGD